MADAAKLATILLADDDESVRHLASHILRLSGYEVIEACDGGHALKLAKAAGLKIDILVTDVIMPEVNGIKLCEQLRLERPDLKVIYMSGYMESILVASEMPELLLLQKPFGANALVAKVREVLGDSRKNLSRSSPH